MRHPLHPILVHFPVAAWFFATIGDVLSLFLGDQVGWVAGVLLVIGTVTAIFAMVPGLIELAKIDQQSMAMRIANQHMVLAMTSWSFYTVSLFLRLEGSTLTQPSHFAIILSLAGFLFLCAAGWKGGRLVYEFGIGVQRPQK
ncbi:MAG TPA: DUF2231 domain-containing protein [Nitrosomonas sp.]|uniref:DUF2231 domain-containing protein n=1 Tax=Nitrosomonas sp. TaxID=42353 RepID=UPI000E863847|nr:DUF2231 domain-containing protein [Nitrosomonas sp.]GJL76767.1 MAG: membrane protein [Nitrosomonas sp.]HBV21338.1 hypothetical protein [Nitrosomonas sp.]HNP26767.1 DUF2231 domain-containing protein [Nitrosomonas sp.]